MNHPRLELAALAARLIAEDGLDYALAKRKAAQSLFGVKTRIARNWLPSNDEIAAELRIYQQLFQADFQPQRLLHLRREAIQLMHLLQDFEPWLAGAVWNGTAGEHSQIHIELYTEAGTSKEVAIFLLNHGLNFDTHEIFKENCRERIEVLELKWHNEIAHISVYDEKALSKMKKKNTQENQRGRIDAVLLLMHKTYEN